VRCPEGIDPGLKTRTKELTAKAVGLSMFDWLPGRRFDRILSGFQADHAKLALAVDELRTKLSTAFEKHGNAALVAQLEELNSALERHIRSTRRELGELHKRVAMANPPPPPEPETADDVRARLRERLPIPKIGKGT